MAPFWRRRAHSLGRMRILLLAALPIALVVNVFELPMEPKVIVTLTIPLGVQLFDLILRFRRWETRVDVLRDELQLPLFPGSDVGDVCLLQRAILVQSATDEVGAVRQFRCAWPDLISLFAPSGPGSLFGTIR